MIKALLLLLALAGPAAAQSNPGFVSGATLCAATVPCGPGLQNPMSLNQAFMAKLDYVPIGGVPSFSVGILSQPAVPGTVNNNPGQYNCFIGSTIYCGNTSGIETIAPGFTSPGVSTITASAPSGAIAGLFNAQCSLNTGGGYTKCGPTIQAFVEADSSVQTDLGVGTAYFAALLQPGTDPIALGGGRVATSIMHEVSTINLWTYRSADPYTYNPNAGAHGFRVDCGIGSSTFGGVALNNCGGAAYEVVPNPRQYQYGYMCSVSSLVVTGLVGVPGISSCVVMADTQAILWQYCTANCSDPTGTAVTGAEAAIFAELSTNPFLHFAVPANGTFEWDVNGTRILNMDAAEIYPLNNTMSLGLSSFRFANMFSVLGNFSGGMTMSGLPTSAGGGGLAVCVDTSGVLYKKATCP